MTNGDNVTMIASSIQDAINAVPTLPFTASSSAGVVTLTARHKGLCGNEIPVSLNYYGFGGGEVLPAGVQIAVVTGTAGTGAPVLTALWLQWRMSRLIISACRSTTRPPLTRW